MTIYVPGKLTLRQGFSPVGIGGDDVYETEVSGTVYRVHVFTTVGESEFIAASPISNLEYLVVAGGGSGSNSNNYAGNGGNAGSILQGASDFGTINIPVIIGAGGIGLESLGIGNPGANSSFSLFVATGGQGASAPSFGTQGSGGTGAGAAASGINGGAGLESDITGVSTYYGGGGGGVSLNGVPGNGGIGGGGNGVNGGEGMDGTNETGGGGGAGQGDGSGNAKGGNGGSGIVIVRYAI